MKSDTDVFQVIYILQVCKLPANLLSASKRLFWIRFSDPHTGVCFPIIQLLLMHSYHLLKNIDEIRWNEFFKNNYDSKNSLNPGECHFLQPQHHRFCLLYALLPQSRITGFLHIFFSRLINSFSNSDLIFTWGRRKNKIPKTSATKPTTKRDEVSLHYSHSTLPIHWLHQWTQLRI